jgi:hypothetical protein
MKPRKKMNPPSSPLKKSRLLFTLVAICFCLVAGLRGQEPITFSVQDKAYALQFNNTAGVGLAALQHEGRVLLVFNQKLDLKKPQSDALGDFFDRFTVLSTPSDFTIVELEAKPGLSFAVQRGDKGDWQLVVGYKALRSFTSHVKNENTLEIKTDAWPAVKVLHLQDKKELFFEHEGIRYYIVPTSEADDGLRLNYETPFFGFASTLQGFACRIYADKTFFTVGEDGLHITTHDPIALARVDHAPDVLQAAYPSIMAAEGKDKDIIQEQRNFEHRIKGDALSFNPHHEFKRAWYYVAAGNGASAQAVLNTLIRKHPGIAYHPLFKFLTGVAQFLQAEYDIAYDYLAMLPSTQETLFWGLASRGRMERVSASSPCLAFGQRLINTYPNLLAIQAFEVALELSARLEDLAALTALLDTRLKINHPHYMVLNRFYTAKLYNMQGKRKEAYDMWRALINSPDARLLPPRLKVEAENEIVMADKQAGILKPEAALAKLEALRLSWRGDFFEYTLMREIVTLQIELKRYVEALTYLKRMGAFFPRLVLMDLINTQIESVLLNYFKENENSANPLQAIALFQEFHAYIPANDEGQQITLRIADQFEKLDLLNQAAEVLTKLQARMGEGIEKNRLIVRIARLHNANKKFEAALTTLETLPTTIPPEIIQARSLNQADAFLGLSRKPEALAALSVWSDPVLLRRACDILMMDKNWDEAERKLSMYINLLDNTKDKEAKQKAVVDLALVLHLNNKPRELAMLKDAHVDLMKDQPLFDLWGYDGSQALTRDGVEKQLTSLNALRRNIEKAIA